MARKSYADKLSFLISQRFPNYWELRGRKADDPELKALESYEAELSRLTQREFAERFIKVVADAEEQADRLEFFNRPDFTADFSFWCSLDRWSSEEAAALLLGKDPKQINSRTLGEIRHASPFRRLFEDLKHKMSRARVDGKLRERDAPSNFVKWAQKVEFPVAPPLLEYVEQPEDAPIEGRERTSMLTLIIGMACKHYGYNVDVGKSDVPARIVKDLSDFELDLTAASVRKYLREAAPLLTANANKKKSS